MKKLPLCFFLIVALAPLVFADGGAFAVSRLTPGQATESADTSTSTSRRDTSTVSRNSANVVSRTAANETSDLSGATVTSRTATPRNTVVRTMANITERNTVSRGNGAERVLNLNNASQTRSVPRGTVNTLGTGTVSRTAVATNTVSVPGRSAISVSRAAQTPVATAQQSSARRTTNIVQRPVNATDVATGAVRTQNRNAVSRAATNVPTAESIAEATQRLDLTSDLNASCQQQYNDCMDQFCNVIDANQGRCSCSAMLDDYVEVEEAVTDANNQLNEVAQRIRYVGLSADEIRAIMNETEAEEALSGARDTSETRSMLDEIEDLISDPISTSSSYSSSSMSFGLDMNLDFSANVADIFSLDFLNTGTSSLSNLRGTSLYNAARNRCRTVLQECEDAGANIDQITANYDLAVDRDCIEYGQGLTKMNETLVSNVRSANLMLQKARLAVRQNQNQYDGKGCIAALDACMTDEMVCGADYNKCLDPTKRYIDENGEVVIGQDITKITEFMANYNNAKIDRSFLNRSYGINTTLDPEFCAAEATDTEDDKGGNDGRCIAKYLLQKIGTNEVATAEGLCRPVLDKCRAYTYDDDRYIPYNDIVVNYVQRAMVNIRAQQQRIISDYSSTCILDVANCYNQQVTQVNAWSSTANVSSIYSVMRGACRNVALTCAYAVFADDETHCPADDNDTCIQSISEMFYQSLLCPDNAMYAGTSCQSGVSPDGTVGGCVNNMCKCIGSYESWGTYCYAPCGEHATRNSNRVCVCDSGYIMKNGVCVYDDGTGSGGGNGGGGNGGGGNDDEPDTPNCGALEQLVNGECVCVANATKVSGKCQCNPGFVQSGNACVPQQDEQTDQEKCAASTLTKWESNTCLCVENAVRTGNGWNCKCDDGYVEEKGACVPEESSPAKESCLQQSLTQWDSAAERCICVENAELNGKYDGSTEDEGYYDAVAQWGCKCKDYYNEENGVCVYGGMTQEECESLHLNRWYGSGCMCVENASRVDPNKYYDDCQCDEGFAEKDGECVPTVCDNLEELKDDECVCVANATKDENHVCQCDEGFVEKNGVCVPESCGQLEEVVGTECVCVANATRDPESGLCQCDENYEQNQNACEPQDCGMLGSFDTESQQCVCIEHAVQDPETGRCDKCEEGYTDFNKPEAGLPLACYPYDTVCNLGTWDDDYVTCRCFPGAHLTTVNSWCECDDGKVPNADKTGCIPESCGALEEIVDFNCECVENATRNPEGTCVCDEGFVEEDGKCVPKGCGVLEQEVDGECVCVANAVRNSQTGLCQCNNGFENVNNTCKVACGVLGIGRDEDTGECICGPGATLGMTGACGCPRGTTSQYLTFKVPVCCTTNSKYNSECTSTNKPESCLNNYCACVDGYDPYDLRCVESCGAFTDGRNTDGSCKCVNGASLVAGTNYCECDDGYLPIYNPYACLEQPIVGGGDGGEGGDKDPSTDVDKDPVISVP